MKRKSHFKTGYCLDNLKGHEGKLHDLEVCGEIIGNYIIPYSILYDVPIQNKKISCLNSFKNNIDIKKLSTIIKQEKYSDKKLLNKAYGSSFDRYLEDMHNVFRLCNSGHSQRDVEIIIKKAQELVHTDPEITLHMLSMLSILELIGSEKSFNEINNFFGGQKHLPIYPEEITIYITYNCNLFCSHCGFRNNAFFFDDKEKQLFSMKKDKAIFMPIDLLKKVAEQSDELRCKKVYIDGGEALLHPNIDQIINLFSGKSFHPVLLTNGTLLNEELCNSLMQKDWQVILSIDGPNEEVHDSIRGKGSFKKTLKSINLLNNAKERHNSGLISIHMVAQDKNADKIAEYKGLADSLCVDGFYIDLYHGTVKKFDEDSYEKIDDSLNNIQENNEFEHIRWIKQFKNGFYNKDDLINGVSAKTFFKNNRCGCYIFNKSLTIDPFGDVYPCWKTLQSFNKMGNLNEQRLKDIWFGEKYSSFRRSLKVVKPEEDKRHENCVFCEFASEIDKLNKRFSKRKSIRDNKKRKMLFIDFLPHTSSEDFCQISALEVQMYKDYLKYKYELVENFREADLIIFNSCASFSSMQDANIKRIKQMIAEKKENAKLVVVGCLPKIDKEALDKISPKLYDIEIQNKLDKIKEETYNKGDDSNHYSKYRDADDFIIKTGEGCAQACSYCSIKLSRGNIKSKKIYGLVLEFKKGLGNGFKNFVIVGTDVGSYGLDINTDIVSLLEAFAEVIDESHKKYGHIRMEIEDFNPIWLVKYGERIKKIIKKADFIKKISLPLESGSKSTLSRMNRNYDPNEVIEIVKSIKDVRSDIKFSTHFIVGFPGESGSDFQEDFKFVEPFDLITLIPFDRRKGTKAYDMTGRIEQDLIKTRIKEGYKKLKEIGKDVRIFPFEREIELLREMEMENLR